MLKRFFPRTGPLARIPTASRRRGTSAARLAACFGAAVGILVVCDTPARADFKICNDTASRIGVAIGYASPTGELSSEGWWTIASQTCEVLLRGSLPSRRVYIRAVDYDQGGGWGGDTVLCTTKASFAISGVRDCRASGYDSEGFMEVDTGGSNQWTVRLSDPKKQVGDGS